MLRRMSLSFYDKLPSFTRFNEVADSRHYTRVPADWAVVITDVKGSTRAISENRYKDVNMLGASSIVAVLNALGRKVPFVFGGDGATILIHESEVAKVVPALNATKRLAVTAFAMDLRAGIVPIRELEVAGAAVEVAKFKVSEHATLAMIRGGGLNVAEKWVKSPEKGHRYAIEVDQAGEPSTSFEGLSCRWNPVPAKRGEMLSLLVAAIGPESDTARIYASVLAGIESILGSGSESHPVAMKNLDSRIRPKNLRAEIKLRGKTRWVLARPWLALRVFAMHLFVHGSYRLGLKFKFFDPGKYVSDLVASTDFRKFDDMLRMICDCDARQRRALESFLEKKRQTGEIAYGIHVSDQALMTCLVFSLQDHVHFIDGAGGGYAMAAKQLKEQLAGRHAGKVQS